MKRKQTASRVAKSTTVMSYVKKNFVFSRGGLNKLNIEELKTLARKILKNSVHGICFSPYDEYQRPETNLTHKMSKKLISLSHILVGVIIFMHGG